MENKGTNTLLIISKMEKYKAVYRYVWGRQLVAQYGAEAAWVLGRQACFAHPISRPFSCLYRRKHTGLLARVANYLWRYARVGFCDVAR
nr:hypothetical protein [bacterium]